MKNKKGFTLVELLAVIVILALIMGIAVVSIGGVLQSSREKTFRETAASLINGVRQQLYITNKLKAGYYCFDKSVLERGGEKSSYGDDLKYSCSSGTEVAPGVRLMASDPSSCTAESTAYIHVTESGGIYSYSICLSDGTHYLEDATEEDLLSDGDSAEIKEASS